VTAATFRASPAEIRRLISPCVISADQQIQNKA
jgi:hypothetical protein